MQKGISKEEWVSMFREINLDDAAMKKWHQIFEQKHPDGHQSFLEWLSIPAEEIARIRATHK